MRLRVICILLTLIAFVIGMLVKIKIRPFFYNEGMYFYGLLGALPNFLYVFGVVAAIPVIEEGIFGKKWPSASALFNTTTVLLAGMAVYEITQAWNTERTFDILDLLASVAGGLFAWAIYKKIHKEKNLPN